MIGGVLDDWGDGRWLGGGWMIWGMLDDWGGVG